MATQEQTAPEAAAPLALAPVPSKRPQRQQEALDRLYERLGELAPLSSTAIRLINACNDEATGAEEVEEIVAADPALAARILRMVNSSSHAPRQPVKDLRSAIARLGFREIRTLAVTAQAAVLFAPGAVYRGYSREQLWRHMVSVANVSRMIAQVSGRVRGDEAYLAGLLHDIGLIVIDQHLRRHFRAILDSLSDEIDTLELERGQLSFDHCELGAFVLKKWELPESIWASAGFHHEPAKYDGAFQYLVYVVSIANYFCAKGGCTSLGVFNLAPPPQQLFASLQLDATKVRHISENFEAILDDSDAILAS